MKSRYLVAITLLGGILSAGVVVGDWQGDLKVGMTKLPLVLHFKKGCAATLDSPKQNAWGIPMLKIYHVGDTVSLMSKELNVTYQAKIRDGKLVGTFRQNGLQLPLTMCPVAEEDVASKSAKDVDNAAVDTLPYVEIEGSFESFDGTVLKGTITMPKTGSQMDVDAVVVMVTGSGPQNRDEEIFGHKPFAVIADCLARNGISSFRYDDRGTGESGGNYAASTIDTFEKDLEAAIAHVRDHFEYSKHGILGHSEGGTLAVIAASKSQPDFIISLAGMMTPARETMLRQNADAFDKLGIDGQAREDGLKLISLVFDEIRDQYNLGVEDDIDVDEICISNQLHTLPGVVGSVKLTANQRTPYLNSLISLDPTEALKSVRCPVLAINGTKDVQVDACRNLGLFREYVPTAEIKRMEGLNHMMQHAETGAVSEYAEIEETIALEVLEEIMEFIRRQ